MCTFPACSQVPPPPPHYCPLPTTVLSQVPSSGTPLFKVRLVLFPWYPLPTVPPYPWFPCRCYMLCAVGRGSSLILTPSGIVFLTPGLTVLSPDLSFVTPVILFLTPGLFFLAFFIFYLFIFLFFIYFLFICFIIFLFFLVCLSVFRSVRYDTTWKVRTI